MSAVRRNGEKCQFLFQGKKEKEHSDLILFEIGAGAGIQELQQKIGAYHTFHLKLY